MLPVFLDLTGLRVLIVGGGPVGLRKARAVCEAGGSVRLVCLEPRPVDLDDPGIDWQQEPYCPAHMDDVSLVLACAGGEVDRRVADEARARGLWVNVASEPSLGTFHLGAEVRRGHLVVAIGTGGAAPALARRIREQLERQFDNTHADWVALLAEMRPLVLQRIADPLRRRAVFEQLTDEAWLERLREQALTTVRQAMLEIILAMEPNPIDRDETSGARAEEATPLPDEQDGTMSFY